MLSGEDWAEGGRLSVERRQAERGGGRAWSEAGESAISGRSDKAEQRKARERPWSVLRQHEIQRRERGDTRGDIAADRLYRSIASTLRR